MICCRPTAVSVRQTKLRNVSLTPSTVSKRSSGGSFDEDEDDSLSSSPASRSSGSQILAELEDRVPVRTSPASMPDRHCRFIDDGLFHQKMDSGTVCSGQLSRRHTRGSVPPRNQSGKKTARFQDDVEIVEIATESEFVPTRPEARSYSVPDLARRCSSSGSSGRPAKLTASRLRKAAEYEWFRSFDSCGKENAKSPREL